MKFCIIGLGRLGYQVATVLADNGMEVMAVDSNESIVASIKDKVTQAICMRVTDEASLRSISVDEMDTVIVATGENFAQSILITALLKKRLNMPHVITRAIDDIHKDILKLVGADDIILPEKEIGIKLADQLSHPFTQLLRLSKDFYISTIKAPSFFISKTIAELNFFEEYHIHCIGLKEDEIIKPIDPSYMIEPGDTLVCAGNEKDLTRVAQIS